MNVNQTDFRAIDANLINVGIEVKNAQSTVFWVLIVNVLLKMIVVKFFAIIMEFVIMKMIV